MHNKRGGDDMAGVGAQYTGVRRVNHILLAGGEDLGPMLIGSTFIMLLIWIAAECQRA
jgi:hypothetical protein